MKEHKAKQGKRYIPYLDSFATDFVKYCLTNSVYLDTTEYYPQQDNKVIESYIDRRLKSSISDKFEFVVADKNYSELKFKQTRNGYYFNSQSIEYFLPGDYYSDSVFHHLYGLKYLDESIIEYISGKDFLDIGSFVGDSAILFEKKYNAKNVYAYEPVSHTCKLLDITLQGNNCKATHIVKKGVGEVAASVDFYVDTELFSSSTLNKNLLSNRGFKETIDVTTIDEECKNRNIGLIKMDIEGAEYSAIKGAKETIMRDQPVLLVSMYHTGKDFFEIPPLLRSYVASYQFRFLDISPNNPLFEKILVAYPTL